MGNCGASLTPEEKRARALDEQLRRERTLDQAKIKLLLLGAGESGKSTLFKQMKILYSAAHGFSEKEKQNFVPTIHGNIMTDMKVLVDNAGTVKCEDAVAEFNTWDKRRKLNSEDCKTLQAIWDDSVVTQRWENRGDLQIQDSLEYNMDNIERICADGYVPLQDDILRARVRTTGVVHEKFSIGGSAFEMYDVGGQRNERKKWIHSFEYVTSVMFVAAISEYNQVLFEDQRQSRQTESIELFGQMLANEYFRNTPFILFLNKKDLLRKKLPVIPFRVEDGKSPRNVDFQGPHCEMNREKAYKTDGSDPEFESCYDAACNYLKEQYLLQQNNAPDRSSSVNVYTHFTNSTDSENIKKIMQACKDIMLRSELAGVGLLN